MSVGVEVSAEPFGIGAKVTGGFEWQHQQMQTTTTETSSTVELSWGLSGPLDPGEPISCTALVQRGEGYSGSYCSRSGFPGAQGPCGASGAYNLPRLARPRPSPFLLPRVPWNPRLC